jgi:uncharacterized protein YoxC
MIAMIAVPVAAIALAIFMAIQVRKTEKNLERILREELNTDDRS